MLQAITNPYHNHCDRRTEFQNQETTKTSLKQ